MKPTYPDHKQHAQTYARRWRPPPSPQPYPPRKPKKLNPKQRHKIVQHNLALQRENKELRTENTKLKATITQLKKDKAALQGLLQAATENLQRRVIKMQGAA